tara:strand:+ start:257 stop:1171 length:915 start_codon:yes stop_codon:yes gene_type:complete
MKHTKAIVSLADDKYFSLLIELIESIKSFQESKDVAICILDAGLSNNNKTLLKPLVNEIKKAEWDIDVPDYKIKGREWLKSQVSRAFLPKYFPEYERYLWLDSDTWINNWEAVEMFYKGCENNKLAIVQSIAPGYKDVGRVNWIFKNLASVKTQNYKHAKNSGFSDKIARKIAFAPHLNIGAFSLQKSSTIWKKWQELLRESLMKGRIFGSEGLAINILVYFYNIDTEFLPARYNWIASHLLPKFDNEKNIFVEPFIPHNKIGILHLAAGIFVDGKDMRLDKNIRVEIKQTDGKKILKSLRFVN